MVSFTTLAFVLVVALVAVEANPRRGGGGGSGRGEGDKPKGKRDCAAFLGGAADRMKEKANALDDADVNCKAKRFVRAMNIAKKFSEGDCAEQCPGEGDGESATDAEDEINEAFRDDGDTDGAAVEESCDADIKTMQCALRNLRCKALEL